MISISLALEFLPVYLALEFFLSHQRDFENILPTKTLVLEFYLLRKTLAF